MRQSQEEKLTTKLPTPFWLALCLKPFSRAETKCAFLITRWFKVCSPRKWICNFPLPRLFKTAILPCSLIFSAKKSALFLQFPLMGHGFHMFYHLAQSSLNGYCLNNGPLKTYHPDRKQSGKCDTQRITSYFLWSQHSRWNTISLSSHRTHLSNRWLNSHQDPCSHKLLSCKLFSHACLMAFLNLKVGFHIYAFLVSFFTVIHFCGSKIV